MKRRRSGDPFRVELDRDKAGPVGRRSRMPRTLERGRSEAKPEAPETWLKLEAGQSLKGVPPSSAFGLG